MKQRTDRMTDLNQTISIITLSVNSLNISIRSRRKKDPTICGLQTLHFKYEARIN